jgi:hypothetical protein
LGWSNLGGSSELVVAEIAQGATIGAACAVRNIGREALTAGLNITIILILSFKRRILI